MLQEENVKGFGAQLEIEDHVSGASLSIEIPGRARYPDVSTTSHLGGGGVPEVCPRDLGAELESVFLSGRREIAGALKPLLYLLGGT